MFSQWYALSKKWLWYKENILDNPLKISLWKSGKMYNSDVVVNIVIALGNSIRQECMKISYGKRLDMKDF